MLGDVLPNGETLDNDERFVDRLAALAQHIELSLKKPSIVGGGGFDELSLGLLQRLREPRTLFRRRLLGEIAVLRRECGHAIEDAGWRGVPCPISSSDTEPGSRSRVRQMAATRRRTSSTSRGLVPMGAQ